MPSSSSATGSTEPVYVQYWAYLKTTASGDLGTSVTSHRPVTTEIKERFPATVELAFAAMIFALVFGLPLGFYRREEVRSPVDHGSLFLSLIGISIPVFFLAIMLKYIFAVRLGWLPTVGRQDVLIDAEHPTGFYVLDGIITRNWAAAWDATQHLILPGDRARVDPARDHLARHARVGARRPERGLRPHCPREGRAAAAGRPPARIPQRAAPGDDDHRSVVRASCSAGAVLTETVFAIPGMGSWLKEAIFNHDYPVLQGGIMFLALVFVIVNLVVDISYAFINPRIRVS